MIRRLLDTALSRRAGGIVAAVAVSVLATSLLTCSTGGSAVKRPAPLVDYPWAPGYVGSDACAGCHDPHRANAMKKPVENNAVCTQCHDEYLAPADLADHTGHGPDPKANAGSKCISCHMPRIVAHAGSRKISSHTFRWPNPAESHATNSPDACLLCHGDRDAAWSEKEAARIWPKLSSPR